MVFEPDMGSGLGQYLDIDFIIVQDEHMSQCLLAGWSGVELLDPSGELFGSFEYVGVPLSYRSEPE